MKRFALFLAVLATPYCKPVTQAPEAVVQASGDGQQDAANCRQILTTEEELRVIEFAAEIADRSFAGRVTPEEKNEQLDALIRNYKDMKRNAVRAAIAKAQEFVATAWVLPRAIALLGGENLTGADYEKLEMVGVPQDYADDYLTDVANYFKKPYATMQAMGFSMTQTGGWELAVEGDEYPSLEIQSLIDKPERATAMMLFFGPQITSGVLNAERDETIFLDQNAVMPPVDGVVTIVPRTTWEKRVKDTLKMIQRESETFVRASKEANTYSNRMKGRVLEWFGIERGHNGRTAPEIEMDGAYKALLSHIRRLRSDMGVGPQMRSDLYALMTTLNNIDLQNIKDGIRKLNVATAAAIAAPFLPVVIWAAPHLGAAAMGAAWGPAIAGASAKMALLPMVFAAGSAAITAGIRTANLGGGFMCNFYEQFSDTGAQSLVAAPFLAMIPVGLAGGGAATAWVTGGAMCAQTGFGVLNLGLSVGFVGLMAKSGIQELVSCHEELEKAHKAGAEGSMQRVNLHTEKAWQDCVKGGIDLGFAIVLTGRLSAQAYEAIRAKSWKPLIGPGCGGFGLAGGGCPEPREHEKVATIEQLKGYTKDSGRLHSNIGNTERLDVIKDVPLDKVTSAPGHHHLRKPEAVVGIGKGIAQTNDRGAQMLKDADKIILNVYTNANAEVKAIEVLDGNHRFAGGLYAEKIAPGKGWKTIGDIPSQFVEVRVNGYNTNGQKLPRWIPLEIAENSQIPRDQWRFIPPEWGAKGPTAEIAGDIRSTSSRFKAEHRGSSIAYVLRVSLERIGVSLP